MATRVVLLTQWFDPEPTFKGLAFARELVRLGFEVEVVTGFPNYPGGKVYPGYRIRLLQREVVEGVQVTRLPLYPSHDGSALRRIANYLSFAFCSIVYGLFLLKRPDVMYAYHPPLTVGVAASLIRLFRRIPVVYDIQDMWPDTLRATRMVRSERILSIVSLVCDLVYRNVDRVVVLSPGFKNLLVARGIPDEKIEVIYNWCDEDALQGAAGLAVPAGFPGEDHFRVVFAGNMGKAQALHAVVAAAALLKDERPDVCFVMVGSGVAVDVLKKEVETKELRNVVFIPRVPMAQVGAILDAADALLVHLKNDPLFSITIPSKTQAYMAIGKPVIMAVPGDAARLIELADCGVTAESENPRSIADAVVRLVNLTKSERVQMATRSKDFYTEKMSLAVGVKRFAACFQAMKQGRS